MPPNILPEEEHTPQFRANQFILALLLVAIAVLLVAAMVQANVSTGLPPGTGSALWTIATDRALIARLRLCFSQAVLT